MEKEAKYWRDKWLEAVKWNEEVWEKLKQIQPDRRRKPRRVMAIVKPEEILKKLHDKT